MKHLSLLSILSLLPILLSGCLVLRTNSRLSNQYNQKKAGLVNYIEDLKNDFDSIQSRNDASIETKRKHYHNLLNKLKQLQEQSQLEFSTVDNSIVINVLGQILFNSGSETIRPNGEKLLNSLLKELKNTNYMICVEGHTDSTKIYHTKDKYHDNWDLGAARAVNVAHYILASGIEKRKVRIASFGQYQPVKPNKTAEDRKSNRRVTLILTQPQNEKVSYRSIPNEMADSF